MKKTLLLLLPMLLGLFGVSTAWADATYTIVDDPTTLAPTDQVILVSAGGFAGGAYYSPSERSGNTYKSTEIANGLGQQPESFTLADEIDAKVRKFSIEGKSIKDITEDKYVTSIMNGSIALGGQQDTFNFNAVAGMSPAAFKIGGTYIMGFNASTQALTGVRSTGFGSNKYVSIYKLDGDGETPPVDNSVKFNVTGGDVQLWYQSANDPELILLDTFKPGANTYDISAHKVSDYDSYFLVAADGWQITSLKGDGSEKVLLTGETFSTPYFKFQPVTGYKSFTVTCEEYKLIDVEIEVPDDNIAQLYTYNTKAYKYEFVQDLVKGVNTLHLETADYDIVAATTDIKLAITDANGKALTIKSNNAFEGRDWYEFNTSKATTYSPKYTVTVAGEAVVAQTVISLTPGSVAELWIYSSASGSYYKAPLQPTVENPVTIKEDGTIECGGRTATLSPAPTMYYILAPEGNVLKSVVNADNPSESLTINQQWYNGTNSVERTNALFTKVGTNYIVTSEEAKQVKITTNSTGIVVYKNISSTKYLDNGENILTNPAEWLNADGNLVIAASNGYMLSSVTDADGNSVSISDKLAGMPANYSNCAIIPGADLSTAYTVTAVGYNQVSFYVTEEDEQMKPIEDTKGKTVVTVSYTDNGNAATFNLENNPNVEQAKSLMDCGYYIMRPAKGYKFTAIMTNQTTDITSEVKTDDEGEYFEFTYNYPSSMYYIYVINTGEGGDDDEYNNASYTFDWTKLTADFSTSGKPQTSPAGNIEVTISGRDGLLESANGTNYLYLRSGNTFLKPAAMNITALNDAYLEYVDFATLDGSAPALTPSTGTLTGSHWEPAANAAGGPAYAPAGATTSVTFTPTADTNLLGTTVGIKSITTGITTVETIGNIAPVYYNLQGVRVAKPAAGGIYIRVIGNASEKVIVK